VVIAVAVEIIQNRGLVFSMEPLRPDFSRLNPATGIKRLLSLRLLKELGKNLFKAVLYVGAAFVFLRNIARTMQIEASDGRQLPAVMLRESGRLLLIFIVLAAIVALLDQLLARREFSKQMRMSR